MKCLSLAYGNNTSSGRRSPSRRDGPGGVGFAKRFELETHPVTDRRPKALTQTLPIDQYTVAPVLSVVPGRSPDAENAPLHALTSIDEHATCFTY